MEKTATLRKASLVLKEYMESSGKIHDTITSHAIGERMAITTEKILGVLLKKEKLNSMDF